MADFLRNITRFSYFQKFKTLKHDGLYDFNQPVKPLELTQKYLIGITSERRLIMVLRGKPEIPKCVP